MTITKIAPKSISWSSALMLTSAGKMLMKAAPMIGPSVVPIPPNTTIARMLTATDQPNWPGEMKPSRAKPQPAAPASAAERAKRRTLMIEVRAPIAAASGSPSRIASSTG